jgi:hypothetical protein
MPNPNRDRVISAAIKAGKFPESRRSHYERLYAADPAGTEAFIATLTEGAVVPDSYPEVGDITSSVARSSSAAVPPAPGGDGSYPSQHLTDTERARISAAQRGEDHSRIVPEV